MKRVFLGVFVVLGLGIGVAAASANSLRPSIDFESPAYALATIDGQNGWVKSGPYDAEVVDVNRYLSAVGYGFGNQALRISDAVTSGSFGDQTFSPRTLVAAGESPAGPSYARSTGTHFEAFFRIGTTMATEQKGLHVSVSPDDGNGGRMSYLSFEDQADGVHVYFADATFEKRDIATLSRGHAHSVRFVIDFKKGPDVVQVFLDGKKAVTGTTWEDYYRYRPGAGGERPRRAAGEDAALPRAR